MDSSITSTAGSLGTLEYNTLHRFVCLGVNTIPNHKHKPISNGKRHQMAKGNILICFKIAKNKSYGGTLIGSRVGTIFLDCPLLASVE